MYQITQNYFLYVTAAFTVTSNYQSY